MLDILDFAFLLSWRIRSGGEKNFHLTLHALKLLMRPFVDKQSRSSYIARGVLHPIFGCPRLPLLSQQTWISKREGTKVGRTIGAWGTQSVDID